ncbi:MAG: hypothetical protein JSU94_12315 [Phycisphaerales bacterium]|nr:MAG: hypothetical protein JSU94_12315 [Phycisphaerales bacterium]
MLGLLKLGAGMLLERLVEGLEIREDVGRDGLRLKLLEGLEMLDELRDGDGVDLAAGARLGADLDAWLDELLLEPLLLRLLLAKTGSESSMKARSSAAMTIPAFFRFFGVDMIVLLSPASSPGRVAMKSGRNPTCRLSGTPFGRISLAANQNPCPSAMSIIVIMVGPDTFVKGSIINQGPFLTIEGVPYARGNANLHENRTFFGLVKNPDRIFHSHRALPRQPQYPSEMAERTDFALKEPDYGV